MQKKQELKELSTDTLQIMLDNRHEQYFHHASKMNWNDDARCQALRIWANIERIKGELEDRGHIRCWK